MISLQLGAFCLIVSSSYGLAYVFNSKSRKEFKYINGNVKAFEYASEKIDKKIRLGEMSSQNWMSEQMRIMAAYRYVNEKNKKNFGSKDIEKRKAHHQKIIEEVESNKDYYLSDWEG